MLLTLSTTHSPATDLGYLLRKMKWETLPAGKFRHRDHRFEWTRTEFQDWANYIATCLGYTVRFLPIGPEDTAVGRPTQMGEFEKK